jgi:hypothetical protein
MVSRGVFSDKLVRTDISFGSEDHIDSIFKLMNIENFSSGR